MRRTCLLILLLITLLPHELQAQDGMLSVQVVSLPAENPLEGVRVDLFVQGRLQSPSPVTNAAGLLLFDLKHAARPDERKVTVSLSFHKDAFRRLNLTRECSVRGPSGCSDVEIKMEPVSGSSVLTQEEKNLLKDLVSNVGIALFLMPYQQLPANGEGQLSLDVLATSLDRAITTQIQALERGEPSGPRLEPLPAISLIPLSSEELAIPATNFEKLRNIGEYVQGLAVISGSAFAPDTGRIEVSSNFLIIPGADAQVRQRQRVDDRDLPTPLNPFELESRLSPAWGYNTLLALGLREYALAKAATEPAQPAQLLRMYRYLVAARADASERAGMELNDLNTLIELIERELQL